MERYALCARATPRQSAVSCDHCLFASAQSDDDDGGDNNSMQGTNQSLLQLLLGHLGIKLKMTVGKPLDAHTPRALRPIVRSWLTKCGASDWLPEDLTDTFLEAATRRALAPGEVIIRQGQSNQDMFLVRSGSLVVTTHANGGERIGVLREGDIAGQLSFLLGELPKATVAAPDHGEDGCIAKTDSKAAQAAILDDSLTEVMVMKHEELLRLLNSKPLLVGRFFRQARVLPSMLECMAHACVMALEIVPDSTTHARLLRCSHYIAELSSQFPTQWCLHTIYTVPFCLAAGCNTRCAAAPANVLEHAGHCDERC